MKMPAKPERGCPERLKSRLVEESLAPGANVSAIARRENLPPSRLFGWRRKLVASRRAAPEGQALTNPLACQEPDRPLFARVETPRTGTIEVVIGQVLLRAGSDVDAEHLARVIRGVLV